MKPVTEANVGRRQEAQRRELDLEIAVRRANAITSRPAPGSNARPGDHLIDHSSAEPVRWIRAGSTTATTVLRGEPESPVGRCDRGRLRAAVRLAISQAVTFGVPRRVRCSAAALPRTRSIPDGHPEDAAVGAHPEAAASSSRMSGSHRRRARPARARATMRPSRFPSSHSRGSRRASPRPSVPTQSQPSRRCGTTRTRSNGRPSAVVMERKRPSLYRKRPSPAVAIQSAPSRERSNARTTGCRSPLPMRGVVH